MTEYLSLDVRRLSWLETWRMASSFRLFTAAAVMRVIGARIPPMYGFATDGLRFIDPSSVSAEAMAKLTAKVEACRPLGFKPCVWTTTDKIGPIDGYGVNMLHASGTMYAAAVWSQVGLGEKLREQLVLSIMSRLTDGRFLQTVDARQQLNQPPDFDVARLPAGSESALVNKHQERLASVPAERIVRFDEARLKETLQLAVLRIQNFHRQRGVWDVISEADVANIVNRTTAGKYP